jgi:hypothetical protein
LINSQRPVSADSRYTSARPHFSHGLRDWLRTERAKLSRSSPVAEAVDDILKRWKGFTSFLDDSQM